jgi:hypothetical protein
VQACAGVRAQANDVAGVRWNLGLNQNDVKHNLCVFSSKKSVQWSDNTTERAV